MSHHDSPSLRAHDERKAGSIFLLTAGVLVLILLLVVGGLLLGRSDSPTETEDADRAAVRTTNLSELQAADTAQLTTYGWNDKARGIVHIPIDRAMELVLPALNAGATASAKAPQATKKP